jgi:hypothetical protein
MVGFFFEFQPMGKSYVRCRGPTVSYLTILLTLMQVRTELWAWGSWKLEGSEWWDVINSFNFYLYWRGACEVWENPDWSIVKSKVIVWWWEMVLVRKICSSPDSPPDLVHYSHLLYTSSSLVIFGSIWSFWGHLRSGSLSLACCVKKESEADLCSCCTAMQLDLVELHNHPRTACHLFRTLLGRFKRPCTVYSR